MNFSVKTMTLQQLISKVIKGAGFNKIVPLTEYFFITVNGSQLTVQSTDATNFVTGRVGIVSGENGSVIVKAEQLSKLVSRTTKDTLHFSVKDSYLEVKGNGTYKVQIITDQPYLEFDFNKDDETYERFSIEGSTLKKCINVNSGALAKEMLIPFFTGYNVGKYVITSDGIKLCVTELTKSHIQNTLFTKEFASLVNIFPDELLKVEKEKNRIRISNSDLEIFGVEMDGVESYPDVLPLIESEMDGNVSVSKFDLTAVLERMILFTDAFNNNTVSLSFGNTLVITDVLGNSTEDVHINWESKQLSGTLHVNLSLLIDLINSVTSEKINLLFTEGSPLKIMSDNTIQFLSLVDYQKE